MKLVVPILLATGIYYPSDKALEPDRQDALKAIGKVAIEDLELERTLKKWEKQYIPTELKYYGGWTLFFGRIIVDKEVRYEWTF